MHKDISIYIQARMSSSRYPGKVLAPVSSVPLIKHVLDRVKKVERIKEVIVVTSISESDNPLVAYLESINCTYFRGDLNDVFSRFQSAVKCHPAYYCVRLCADSPFLDPELIQFIVNETLSDQYDLVSNVFRRSFPKGQSVEVIRSQLILDTDSRILSKDEQEHVMPYFYKNICRSKCLFFSLNKDLSHIVQCIDTIEDLRKIDAFSYRFKLEDIKKSVY